ncbi:MAG: hypothetical protein JW913_15370 [Chitinispirillaceae bacterium]|nr:hypothetical protein [Chitinispirillaceae bacterium]
MQQPHLTQHGLERRIKRRLTGTPGNFAAITTPGLEEYAAREISLLEGAQMGPIEKGIIEFSGPFDLVYQANLLCGSVNRVLSAMEGSRSGW